MSTNDAKTQLNCCAEQGASATGGGMEKATGKQGCTWSKYATVLGLAVFFAFNFVILLWQPLSKVKPESLPSAHTWTYWATKEFLTQPKSPDVVICGSSVLMHPIARVEAVHKNKNLDYVLDHQSTYFADKLGQAIGQEGLSCFSFALPGSMISDNFMVVRGLLTGPRKPSVIVLGLTLRDFIDSGVTCPGATPPFRYLKRYANIDDVVDLAMPQVWQRFDYWLGKLIYLNGKKMDLQTLLADQTKNFLEPIYKKQFAPCRLVEMDPTRNTASNLRGEIEPGMMIVGPHEAPSYLDNTAEYRKRYKRNDPKMFEIQSTFLEKILAEAKENGVRVIMVNVPVTEQNHTLMPTGAFEKYQGRVKELASKWGVEYFDPANNVQFVQADFYDSVHMNADGGKKLLDQFVSAVQNDSRSLAALSQRASIADKLKSAGTSM